MADEITRPILLDLGVSCLIANDAVIQAPHIQETSHLPSEVLCLSRLRYLRQLHHPSLALYLDAELDKHRRLLVVTEHYSHDFSKLSSQHFSVRWIATAFHDCLSALEFLASHRLVHGHISPTSLLIDNRGHVKVSGHGLFFASHWGSDLNLPILNSAYSAPEMMLHLFRLSQSTTYHDQCPFDSRTDLWSLVLVFLEVNFEGIVSKHFQRQNCAISYLMKELHSRPLTSLVEALDFQVFTESNQWQKTLLRVSRNGLIFDARQRSIAKYIRQEIEIALVDMKELPVSYLEINTKCLFYLSKTDHSCQERPVHKRS